MRITEDLMVRLREMLMVRLREMPTQTLVEISRQPRARRNPELLLALKIVAFERSLEVF